MNEEQQKELEERFKGILREVSDENEPTPAAKEIIDVCLETARFLCDKNRKYGNSALDPMRVFSKADPIEQIDVRIDDKLSRLKTSHADDNEDAAKDLLGYLVLRQVAVKMHEKWRSDVLTGRDLDGPQGR